MPPRPLRDAIKKRRQKRKERRRGGGKGKKKKGKDGEIVKEKEFERGCDPEADIDLWKEMEEKGPDYTDYKVYAVPFEKDPYNIIAVSGLTPESFTAFLVLVMKGAAVCFLYYDLLSGASDNPGNYLQIPPTVTWPVRGCQFISIPLTVVAHPDTRVALYWLSIKYSNPGPDFPQSTKASWGVSLWWRLITGILLAFASFVQINRATRIRTLFLSIQGTMLIGMMDKVMFWLGEFGFLGKRLQIAIKNLENAHIELPDHTSCRKYLKSLLLAVMVGIGWVGWGVFLFYQTSGKYVAVSSCNQFSIIFGDNLWESPVDLPVTARYNVTTIEDPGNPRLVTQTLQDFHFSWFSGTYQIAKLDRGDLSYDKPFQILEIINGRLVYEHVINRDRLTGVEDELPPDRRAGKFWYCYTTDDDDNQIGQWVFSVDAISDNLRRSKEVEDCFGWLLRSKPTDALRLEDVDPDSWLVWTAKGDVEEVVQDDDGNGFTYTCEECQSSVDCNFNGACVEQEPSEDDDIGVVRSYCTCEPGYTGPFCDISASCRSLTALESLDNAIVFDPPLSTNTFYQSTLDGEKATADTKTNDILTLSQHPIYFELEDRFNSIQDAAAAANDDDVPRIRYYFFSSGRWYLGINDATTIVDNFLQRTDLNPFWDQQQLQYVEASGSSDDGTTTSRPLDVDQWVRIITNGEGTSTPIDLTLECADSPVSGLFPTCDSGLTYDTILGCPRELTGQPLNPDSSSPVTTSSVSVSPNGNTIRVLQETDGGPEAAFDGNLETVASSSGLLMLSYPLNAFALSTTVAGYYIYPATNDFSCKDPSSWSLSGCDSLGTCIPLDTQTDQVFLRRTEPKDYTLNPYGTGSYASLLFDFSNSGICNETVQVAEVQVYGYYGCSNSSDAANNDGPPFIEPDLGCSSDATNVLSGNDALLDDDLTTEIEFDSGTVTLEFPAEISPGITGMNAIISAYSIATSVGPQVCQSPQSWTLFVCGCDDFCTPIDTRERQTLEANVRETFQVPDPLGHVEAGEIYVEKVKLVITNSNNDPCGIILTDFRLYTLSTSTPTESCSGSSAFDPPTPSPVFDNFNGEIDGEIDGDGEDYDYLYNNYTDSVDCEVDGNSTDVSEGNSTGCKGNSTGGTGNSTDDYQYGNSTDDYQYEYDYYDYDGEDYTYGYDGEGQDEANIFITKNAKDDEDPLII